MNVSPEDWERAKQQRIFDEQEKRIQELETKERNRRNDWNFNWRQRTPSWADAYDSLD